MRYVRFLKAPRIIEEKNSSKAHVYCLVTITSDLGDSFLPFDVSLSAEIRAASPTEEVLIWRTVQWGSGMRSLPVTIPLSQSRSRPIRVRIGLEPKSSADEWKSLVDEGARGVVSAWSAPFGLQNDDREAAKLVERYFKCSAMNQISVWEETGESIARHLWDAGITLAFHIDEFVDVSNFGHLLSKSVGGRKRLRVLELGTGCGIVGINIAQSLKSADVILTDLPDAEEIVRKNINETNLAKGTAIRFQQLNWEDEIRGDLRELDLVVAADCTYNSDSSPALVKTLRSLTNASPKATVIIAMKKRHLSEEIFFSLMSEAGFKIESTKNIPLPGDERTGEEYVYVYTFRLEEYHTKVTASWF